jgi:hypothetical protein
VNKTITINRLLITGAAGAFRDATGLGRNVTIEVLEYFELLGFTHRDGDTRIIFGDGDRFFATRKRIQA